jgi:stalled ribosome alternative rescue factor ArfA
MGKDLIHKLDKETKDRHFPESNGGKGSHARKSTANSRETFKSNHDKIDWSYNGKSYIKSDN